MSHRQIIACIIALAAAVAAAATAAAGTSAKSATSPTSAANLPPKDAAQSDSPPTIPTTSPTLPEILVEAPEPRYAAATLRDRIGRIWAPVFINGLGPFRLVLDTGANRSAVVASVANQLGIPILLSSALVLHGATGTAVVPWIAVNRLDVGDLELPATDLPIVGNAFGGAEGVLGNDGFAERRILIDFWHDIVSISRSRGVRAEAGFSTVPVTLVRGRLLSVDVLIGPIRTKAIIDSGAQQTIGNLSLREALARHKNTGVRSEEIVGVTLDVAKAESIATPPIEIGKVKIVGLRIAFGTMPIFEYWKMTHEPALLVGMDVLGSLDTLIIDYKMRELQIRPQVPGRIYR